MRIAWLSPLPPLPTGIADYSYDLLPLIAERADVDVVSPRAGRFRKLRVPEGVRVVDPREHRARNRRYDATFHHLGNNPHHRFVYEAALSHPAIAVFHDFVLHHLVGHLTYEGNADPRRYEVLLREEYGETGARLAVLRFHRVATDFEKFLFPLNGHVARAARAMVVHSEHVRARLEHLSPRASVSVIPHYAPPAPSEVAGLSREEARRILGLPRDAFLVGHFGFVTRPKQPAAILGAFARLAASRSDARLLLVGADHTGGTLQALVDHYRLEDRIHLTGFLDVVPWYRYLRAVDVMVNLRYPSAGESSGTVARALAEGVPVVVNDLGAFSEIPDGVVLKVEVDDDQAEVLAGHLLRLAEDEGLRSATSARARAYASTVLDPARCRDLYLDVAAAVAGADQAGAEQPAATRP